MKKNGMELHDSEKEVSAVIERLTIDDINDDVGAVYFLCPKVHFNLNKYHVISYLQIKSNRRIFMKILHSDYQPTYDLILLFTMKRITTLLLNTVSIHTKIFFHYISFQGVIADEEYSDKPCRCNVSSRQICFILQMYMTFGLMVRTFSIVLVWNEGIFLSHA